MPSFDDAPFRRAEAGSGAARALFARLARDLPPTVEAARRVLPEVVSLCRCDPRLADYFNALLPQVSINCYGPWLGKPPPPPEERLVHLLRLGRIASPGIETLAKSLRPGTLARDETPLVSIVVVAWNQWAHTRECLDSVFRLTRRPSFEVVLVDNASTDETPREGAAWAEREPRLRYVASETNLGFSGGNNLGAEAARGRYLLFLNNDVVVLARDWLRRLVAALEAEERIGAVGQFGVIDLEGEDPPPAFYQVVFFPGIFTPVAWLSGYCLLIRREALRDAGGWRDDLYGLAGWEDIHLGYALRRAGWIPVVPPRWIPIFHKIRATRGTEAAQKHLAEHDPARGRDKAAVFREHFGSRARRENYALPDSPPPSPLR